MKKYTILPIDLKTLISEATPYVQEHFATPKYPSDFLGKPEDVPFPSLLTAFASLNIIPYGVGVKASAKNDPTFAATPELNALFIPLINFEEVKFNICNVEKDPESSTATVTVLETIQPAEPIFINKTTTFSLIGPQDDSIAYFLVIGFEGDLSSTLFAE